MKMLTTGMQGVAHLAIENVNLQATLGGYELAFSVQGQTVTPDPKYWTLAYGAEVQVGARGQLRRLGVARPDSPLRIRTALSAVPVTWEFRLPVTTHQLSIIEGVRENGNLEFKLVISGEGGPVDHPDRVERLHDDFWKEVARSDWIAQLAAAKFTDILLLEIPHAVRGPAGRGPRDDGGAPARTGPLPRRPFSREHLCLPDRDGGPGDEGGPWRRLVERRPRRVQDGPERHVQGTARAGA